MTKPNPVNIYKEKRPWGNFKLFIENQKSTVKLLEVKAGKKISLQYHKKRSEFWYVVSGEGIVQIGNKSKNIKAGQSIYIERLCLHRITSKVDMLILEIAFGGFKESDIVRLEDEYGRAK